MTDLTRRQFLKWTATAGIVGLLASYPVFIERYVVFTNFYRIPVPNLPRAFSGFRIVHLTDLHYGPLVPLWLIRKVISKANQLHRHLTVCTGDYVHHENSPMQIDAVWQALAELNAPAGVFSVLGNHDHWADTERSRYWLNQTGQNLRYKVVPLKSNGDRLWLIGAGDLWEDHLDMDLLLADVPESDCRIVLAHNPDSADTRFNARVDLMISGHTHGGQIYLPYIGAPVLPVKNKSYSYGLKKSPQGVRVFISRGIGWSIYPVRFNCFPEIAVLELISA